MRAATMRDSLIYNIESVIEHVGALQRFLEECQNIVDDEWEVLSEMLESLDIELFNIKDQIYSLPEEI